MKVVIVEDELAASDNLAYMLHKIDPAIEIQAVLDSVRDAVAFFRKNQEPDLVFMDIHLADGLSFEIFEKVRLTIPVVFTTAYNQYALKAFKVNSIDYLLKPIDPSDLEKALRQYYEQREIPDSGKEPPAGKPGIQPEQVSGLLELLSKEARTYKSTFLLPLRDELVPVKTSQIAYIYIDTGVVKAMTFNRQAYPMDQKLEELEAALDPKQFFRANRQFIVQREAITNIKYYFNGKLILKLDPPTAERIVVSKAKAPEFKEWMNA